MLPGREHECNGSFNSHCIRAPWQGARVQWKFQTGEATCTFVKLGRVSYPLKNEATNPKNGMPVQTQSRALCDYTKSIYNLIVLPAEDTEVRSDLPDQPRYTVCTLKLENMGRYIVAALAGFKESGRKAISIEHITPIAQDIRLTDCVTPLVIEL
ncbi:hypothetical protein Tco_1020812 [Tanacetum coccineum]